MINISEKIKCCGCEACVQACPKQCMIFKEDEEGFFYPLVDNALCIDCGLCEKVCPVINQTVSRKPIQCFASKNIDEAIRKKSSSGGVFSLLAEEVIHQGGVVFGAKFNEQWEVEHDYTETIEGLAAFRTSKYVQSRIGNAFRQACVFLKQGRLVLFSGTSCQIAALKLFLHHEYENLLTVDIICHGVPSRKVWRMYLEAVMKKARKGENTVLLNPKHNITKEGTTSYYQKIRGISFRDKRLGWKKYSFALTLIEVLANGKSNSVLLSYMHRKDPYMKVYLSNINLRPSCYQCPAKSGKSGSDITLADYWGIEMQIPEFDDDKGVGLVLLNTQRGIDVYSNLQSENRKVTAEEALSKNPSYYVSVKPHVRREKFFRLLKKKDVDIIALMKSIIQQPLYVRALYKIKQLLR